MITKRQYVQYLISTPVNYTCTNLADHLEDASHDAVNDYLRREKHTARQIWELAEPLINDRPGGYLIADDSVQDKRHSRVMELVKRQYSGNEHGLVKGIGSVNLVHSDGTDHYPIDFRVYAPEVDGLTKNEHFWNMLREAYRKKGIQARTLPPHDFQWIRDFEGLGAVDEVTQALFAKGKSRSGDLFQAARECRFFLNGLAVSCCPRQREGKNEQQA